SGFNRAPAYGFAGRPTGCHKHGPMNGFRSGPASGFNRAPAYGFAGRPTGCHKHGPINGFHRGPANGCGNGRPFFKGFPAPEYQFCGTDIRRTETGYRLEAKLPGFKKEEIAVDLEGRNLKITAKKAESAETKEGENACPDKAKRSGTFCRVFRLKGIRTEDVTASYEDGVLRVDLPKKERPAPEKRSVTIH
ncbi:MAG: Hsp20/alpha crystallin family protein, partial [Lachnospiraceae bacterium]|nr:Hsp20/alpha crystallin family protein [Lachnospiraceae bacterium]